MQNRVLKLEASAGSGKTYRLTLEYLTRLFKLFSRQNSTNTRNIERRILSSIIAITFTNKAANEMKERVLKRLGEFSLAGNLEELKEEDREFLKKLSARTGILQKELLKKSDYVLNAIIENYTDFNIKTIDSLMSSIIKVISPDLNLEADYEIGIDITDELQAEANKFINELAESDWNMVEEFLKDFKNTYKTEKWYMDIDIVENIIELSKKALLEESNPESISDLDISKLKDEVFTRLADFRRKLKDFLILITSEDGEKYRNNRSINKSLRRDMENLISNPEKQKSLKLITGLLTRKFFEYKKPEDFCKNNADKDFLESLLPVFEELKKSLSRLLSVLSRFRLIYYRKFFLEFSNLWSENKDKIYVSEFSRQIKEKFQEWGESALPYLYLKLSDRFIHFLIDEFQDTSELQFKALIPIIEEILSSKPFSSLFIVGDRKQAIYRWRGGNSALMNKEVLLKQINMLQNISDKDLDSTLEFNWRSGKQIIDFNNEFWFPHNIACAVEPDMFKRAVQTNFDVSHQQIPENNINKKAYVNIKINKTTDANTKKEDFKKIILEEVEKSINIALDNGYSGSDIAVLVKRKDRGREIIAHLSGKNIQAISDESLFLSSSVLVNEIIAFFRFLEYPPDNLSFYTFINGEIFKTRAKNVFGEQTKFLEDIDLIKSDETNYYKIFREKFPRLWNYFIKGFFRSVGFLPPYDIFQDIIERFKLYENFKGSSLYFLTFSNMLHNLEQDGINSISSFLEDWDKRLGTQNEYSIDIAEDSQRVRVLTMHKAKGLEFPVVIVPLIDDRDPQEKHFSEKGNFYYITKDYIKGNKKLKKIYKDELEKQYIDQLNLLYVAFTRASDMLFVPVAGRDKSKKREDEKIKRFPGFADTVIHHPMFIDEQSDEAEWITRELGEIITKEEKEKKRAERLKVKSKQTSTEKWQKDFLVFKPGELRTAKDKQVTEIGDAYHRVFQKIITIDSKQDIKGIVTPLIKNEEILNQEDAERIINFISRDDVFPFFKKDFNVYTEKQVVRFSEDEYKFERIDRLLVSEDKFIVIDFKTGKPKDEDKEQIKAYVASLKNIYSDLDCEAYLFYLFQGKFERV